MPNKLSGAADDIESLGKCNTIVDNSDDSFDFENPAVYYMGLIDTSDDPNTSCITFRSVTIGMLFAFLLSIVNTILNFRANLFILPASVAVLISYPIGVFMARVLPASNKFLNPGPFTVKEHVIIYVFANAAGGLAYGIQNVVAQKIYLDDTSVTLVPSVLFVLTTQLIGYGLAGLANRWLVKPKVMIWPSTLASVALFRAFHERSSDVVETKKAQGLSRFKFFWIVFCVMFLYELIPQYFATSLQLISIVCFVSRSNFATWIGSGSLQEGFGFLGISLDWSVISVTNFPLVAPFWATANFFGSIVLWLWVVTPLVEHFNPFGTPVLNSHSGLKYHDGTKFPSLNSVRIYTNNGTEIQPRNLLLHPSLKLDEELMKEAGPIYISNMFAIVYFTSFINIMCVLSHVVLWHGDELKKRLLEAIRGTKNSSEIGVEEDDINATLMKVYPEISEVVYVVFATAMLIIQVFVLEYTPFKLNWYFTILGFFLGLIFIIPIGAVQAITSQVIGLNVLSEFVIGGISPGETIQMMTFKSYSSNIVVQACALIADMKLSHYLHISPRSMVLAQFVGTVIGGVMNAIISFTMMDYLLPQLQIADKANWNPTNFLTTLNAGVLWGALGPARFFGSGSPYYALLLGFPIGLALPLIPWAANKCYPHRYWKYINFPILTYTNYPETLLGSGIVNLVLAAVFQWYIFMNRHDWWSKYNYTLSIGLDTGTAIAIIFVALLNFGHVVFPNWALNPDTSVDYYCFS